VIVAVAASALVAPSKQYKILIINFYQLAEIFLSLVAYGQKKI